MKIELPEGEVWKNERIIVLPVEAIARYVDANGILVNNKDNSLTGKIVAIERLNDDYCAVSLADAIVR